MGMVSSSNRGFEPRRVFRGETAGRRQRLPYLQLVVALLVLAEVIALRHHIPRAPVVVAVVLVIVLYALINITINRNVHVSIAQSATSPEGPDPQGTPQRRWRRLRRFARWCKDYNSTTTLLATLLGLAIGIWAPLVQNRAERTTTTPTTAQRPPTTSSSMLPTSSTTPTSLP